MEHNVIPEPLISALEAEEVLVCHQEEDSYPLFWPITFVLADLVPEMVDMST